MAKSYRNDGVAAPCDKVEPTEAATTDRTLETCLKAQDATNESETSFDVEEEEFEIPQRFTKSGRKRAVSFPLKVRYTVSSYGIAE
jgi:hypothetical protein